MLDRNMVSMVRNSYARGNHASDAAERHEDWSAFSIKNIGSSCNLPPATKCRMLSGGSLFVTLELPPPVVHDLREAGAHESYIQHCWHSADYRSKEV